MDHYIVQIYRRGSAGTLHGVVERVANGSRMSFSSAEELFAILHAGADGPIHRRAARSPAVIDKASRACSSKPAKGKTK